MPATSPDGVAVTRIDEELKAEMDPLEGDRDRLPPAFWLTLAVKVFAVLALLVIVIDWPIGPEEPWLKENSSPRGSATALAVDVPVTVSA